MLGLLLLTQLSPRLSFVLSNAAYICGYIFNGFDIKYNIKERLITLSICTFAHYCTAPPMYQLGWNSMMGRVWHYQLKYDSSIIQVYFKYATSMLQAYFKYNSSMPYVWVKYPSFMIQVSFIYDSIILHLWFKYEVGF